MTADSSEAAHVGAESVNGSLRWSEYILRRNSDFDSFWTARFAEQAPRTLLVAGLGFDPRMPACLNRLLECGAAGHLDICELHFSEGPESPSRDYAPYVRKNQDIVRGLVDRSGGDLREANAPLVDSAGKRTGGRFAGLRVAEAFVLSDYDDIIVDISALPRVIYFPLIKALLEEIDRKVSQGVEDGAASRPRPFNLHVTLIEAPELDSRIREALMERAEFIPGFGAEIYHEQGRDIPRLWAPVLGELQAPALERIEQEITQTSRQTPEICPVLPFPAQNPRRGDELLVEYQGLFSRWGVELRNIIHAAENNPFDVYRELCRLRDRYERALAPLRGARTIVSAHSSKLLSLGALLAAYDRPDIAVAHVAATGYQVSGPIEAPEGGEFHEVWIAGDPYAD